MANSIELQLTPPFDPELSLAFWMRHPLERVDVVSDGIYRRLFIRPAGPVLLQVSFNGSVDEPSCNIELQGEHTPDDWDWAMELCRWILNDGILLEDFYKQMHKADPALAKVTHELKGLRPTLSPTLFETLVFAIVGQQVNLNFAYICRAALEDAYAEKATFDGVQWTACLTPEDFVKADVESLRAMKISRNKAVAILELAEVFRTSPLDRNTLAGMDQDEIIDSLTALRGIGRWTAEYALLRAFGAADVLPAGDAGLRNAIHKLYEREEKPQEEEIRRIGEKWRPYRALATFYLWTWLSRHVLYEKRSKAALE